MRACSKTYFVYTLYLFICEDQSLVEYLFLKLFYSIIIGCDFSSKNCVISLFVSTITDSDKHKTSEVNGFIWCRVTAN